MRKETLQEINYKYWVLEAIKIKHPKILQKVKWQTLRLYDQVWTETMELSSSHNLHQWSTLISSAKIEIVQIFVKISGLVFNCYWALSPSFSIIHRDISSSWVSI